MEVFDMGWVKEGEIGGQCAVQEVEAAADGVAAVAAADESVYGAAFVGLEEGDVMAGHIAVLGRKVAPVRLGQPSVHLLRQEIGVAGQ